MTAASSRQRPRRRWVWVVVALATAAAFAVPFRLQIVPKGGSTHHELDPTVAYRHDISVLQVQANGGAAVAIRAGRTGQVTVTSSLQWEFRKPIVSQAWHGGSFWLGVTCPKLDLFGSCQASIVISVPAGTAVQAQAGAGAVTVAGLTGPLHLSATSGALSARDVSGPVWATVTSGSLVANSGVTSQRFYESVTSGQMTVDFSARPHVLVASVGAGEAEITLPAGSRYRIVSSPGAGALTVAPGLIDTRSDSVLTVTIGTGAASIGYPPASPS